MNVVWEDCEPTMENFLTNVKILDPTGNPKLMMMILYSYFSIHNHTKTPRDLELELRKHKELNVGLIATDWRLDPHLSRIIQQGKGAVVKRKHFHHYKNRPINNIDEVDPEHLADYYVTPSCRKRKYVIEETLSHNISMEDNLEKLEESGDFMIFGTNPKKDDEKTKLVSLVGEGKKLIKLEDIDFEDEFQEILDKNENAKLILYAILMDDSEIHVIADGEKILCPIGLNIIKTEEGEELRQFIPLTELRMRKFDTKKYKDKIKNSKKNIVNGKKDNKIE